MKKKDRITVTGRIVGPIDGRSVNASGTVEIETGATLKDFLRRADAALGLKTQKPFTRVFKQGVRPVVLLNGDRIELPDENKRPLSDGDEISIIVAMAGG